MNFDQLFSNFGDLSVQGLAQGAIYALFALGYTMVYGVLRLINFAHSEVFMVGTFGAILAWSWLGLDQNSPVPAFGPLLLYLLVGLVAACLTSGVTAVVLERVAYRPLRKRNAPVLTFLITAIGASVVMSEAVGIATRRKPWGAPPLIRQKELFTIAGTTITNLQVFLVLLAIVLMLALDVFINRTRLGRGVRAIAQDPNTAALMGVNKDRVISLVFLLGGIMAGAAALMYNIKITGTHFFAGFDLGIKAFAAAVLGGIGNLRGALLGGLLLGVLEGWGSGLLGTQWTAVVAFVVLILILLFRPTGLLGESLGRARA
ncbi:branched-chain amino acid ABC transporter permease [Micromonospora eburnea]|uniref:Amino acid/amide ABC transporter membrane protein 1, HAAT family n=1 Tax=Micromonospora eburnea TaxID=227316 RepID=A0A1C6V6H1_9ACTN|nr:branched-chain amino acid ABC transporter permease [Micromonospora eburnea]SCL61470.1 amino acid/amide ABC transporter membrane protein 1, HAAT family [Micromonospora eburnea]